jgi:hypothetical protein
MNGVVTESLAARSLQGGKFLGSLNGHGLWETGGCVRCGRRADCHG